MKEFIPAFIALQKDIKQPKKNRTNPHFKSKFADLEACFDSVRELLPKHGFMLTQLVQGHPTVEAGTPLLETRLYHASDCCITSEYPLPKDATPQQMGSAITYARRYALCTMFGLVADDDDDGNAAQPTPPTAAQRTAYIAKAAGKAVLAEPAK